MMVLNGQKTYIAWIFRSFRTVCVMVNLFPDSLTSGIVEEQVGRGPRLVLCPLAGLQRTGARWVHILSSLLQAVSHDGQIRTKCSTFLTRGEVSLCLLYLVLSVYVFRMSRAAFSLVAHLAKLHREREAADVTIIYQFLKIILSICDSNYF